jgi:hypothetical protein
MSTLFECDLRGMCHVRIVVSNQTGNDPGDTFAADVPQRIKGRNPNVVELLVLNHFPESLDSTWRPSATQGSRTEVAHPNVVVR